MTPTGLRARRLAVPLAAALLVTASPAFAQFSNHEGFTEDGRYRVMVEVDPYLWLPATSSNLGLAHPPGYTVTRDTPVPTLSQVAGVLDAAVIGAGLLRYGPWSAEVDLQWINANQSRTRQVDGTDQQIRLDAALSLFRVAPGFGYEVAKGDVFRLPASLDLRAGFAYTTVDSSLDPAESAIHGLHVSSSFIQPWLGFRADLYPSTDWRIELGAFAQGLGVDGGSIGWGASLLASYLFTNWLDGSFGFRALNTQRYPGARDPLDGRLARSRSVDITAYGPVLAIGFRF